ncbi:tetratricopeptide repeat protein [Pseudanabaena sp. FACHB-1998]|uniref:tetratricopeptide repeat protein n=1 Tax=Pseudanabaena sp. FACHB-1998 TaxID=2692858 RepID=UPI0016817E57|nr:tetratricopeptide repeat protein [Pseudanabaena sp. FACHB-1998]MBD2178932.1 tetratricopeptide repeat protein [Pseudanabaena sp. FACHB-1998]
MKKKAIVYLMHNSGEQLDLWLQYLPSEDIELVNISPDKDIVRILEKVSHDNLPSLILVEMSIQSPNTKLLQSSNVSRWCKDNQLSIKIIFLTMRPEAEVTKVEQRWADRQGALSILPKLDPQNLKAQFKQIYECLNLELPVIKIIPKAPEIDLVSVTQSALGQAQLLIKKKDFSGAMNQLKEVIKHNRENIEAYLLCGEIYTELKNLEKAIQAYSQAITIDAKYVSSYYKRGLTYSSLKNYHAAIADFNQLINLEQNHAEAYNARGTARKEIGDFEGAKFDYNQAITLKPNYAEAFLNRGMLLYSLGEQAKARQDYEEAVKLDPKYEGSFFSWANNSEIKGLSVF